LALLDATKFAANQLFVTPEESESTVAAVKRTSGPAIERSIDPQFNDQLLGEPNGLSKTPIAITGNVVATASFYFAAARPKNHNENKQPSVTQPDLTKRQVLKYIAWATSVACTVPAIYGNGLRQYHDRSDNLYRGLPTDALRALLDPANSKKLNAFIHQLSLPISGSLLLASPEAYNQKRLQFFSEKNNDLQSSKLTKQEEKRIIAELLLAENSTYDAYALRLGAISDITRMALPQILSAKGTDPLLTMKVASDKTDSIFNIGIGLILNKLVKTIQVSPHVPVEGLPDEQIYDILGNPRL